MDTQVKRTRTKAGAFAMSRHRKNLLNRWGYAAILAVVGGLIMCVLALGGIVPYWIGIPAVPIMYLTFKVWESKTDYSEKRWGVGARAERKVGEKLDRLHEQGFHVFHDLQFEKSNVDHFIVGPQGIFAIETKSWQGIITPGRKQVLRDGKKVEYCDAVYQSGQGAKKARKLTEEVWGREQYVVPVLCITRADVRCFKPVDNVEVTDLASLNRVILQGRKVRYNEQDVARISEVVQKKIGLAPSAAPGLPPEPPSRMKRFVDWSVNLHTLTVLLALLAALSLIFPTQFSIIFGAVSDLYGVLGKLYALVF